MKIILLLAGILLILAVVVYYRLHAMARESTLFSLAGLHNETLQKCPDRPSCVCSLDQREKHAIAPFSIREGIVNPIASIAEIISTFPDSSLQTQGGTYLHVTFTSKKMGFVDDLELQLEGKDTVHVRSVSRVGYADFGVNRERVESIRARLKEAGIAD